MEIVPQLLAAVIVVCGLLVTVRLLKRGVRWRLPSLPGKRRAGIIEPLDRFSLSPNHTLHLVRVGNRAVLLAAHAAGCSLLESRQWSDCGGAGAPTSGGETQ